MRVLQLAAKTFTLTSFVLPLMERLRDAGFDVEAMGPFDGFETRLTDAGFRVHPWQMDQALNPFLLHQARRELTAFLTANPYDIIHTHCSFAGIVANPVAYRHTPCLLYTQHGFYVHEGLNPLMRAVWLQIEKVGLRWPRKVICVSQAERDLAQQLGVGGPDKFFTVPGAGVRLARFQLSSEDRAQRRQQLRHSLGLGDAEPVLLTVSRLTWDKGYHELIEATRRLRAAGRHLRFLAAGSGKDEQGIRQAIAQAGVGDCFTLLGWRDDIVDLLCAADVFVFASHREGLPISTIEAMASGLATVAADIPGCREEIEHERSGLLYPVRDTDGLCQALERVLNDPSLAAQLAAGGRERAQRFGLDRVLDLQLGLYRQLAGGL